MMSMTMSWLGMLGMNRKGNDGLRRRNRGAAHGCGRVEGLEDRLLLTPFDGNWQWGPDPAISFPPDPPPYSWNINPEGVSIIECPEVGGLPITLKIKGDKIKGSGKSGDLKVKLKAVGGDSDNRTPNDGGDINGTLKFSGAEVAEQFRKLFNFRAQR